MKKKTLLIIIFLLWFVAHGCVSLKTYDGNIVYASLQTDGHYDFYLINEDGHNLTKLSTGLPSRSCPIWLQNGKQIMFYVGENEYGEAYVFDLINSELTKGGYGDEVFLNDISMDEKWGLYIKNSDITFEIILLEFANGNETTIISGYGRIFFAVFSPDGQKILFSGIIEEYRQVSWNEDIYIINVDGSDFKRITDEYGREDNILDPHLEKEPVWLIDQSGFVYVSEWRGLVEDTVGESKYTWVADILHYDLSGNTTQRLTNAQHPERNFLQDVSPDSSKILFLSNRDHLDEPDRFDIYIMDLDGSNTIRVTETGNVYCASWRP